MALSATDITAYAALTAAIGGIAVPWLSARLKAKPDAQAVLNESVNAFITDLQSERLELKKDRDELQQEVKRLRVLLSEWEGNFHKAMEWADLLADRLQKHERLPDRPKFNGHVRP